MTRYGVIFLVLISSLIFSNFSNSEAIKLVLTSNVNGETDPCG